MKTVHEGQMIATPANEVKKEGGRTEDKGMT